MIQRGVRLLLVADEDRKVAGIITATDILGEKPLQVIAERGGRRGDVVVRDIMTRQHRLEVLHMEEVRRAKVGYVVATPKNPVGSMRWWSRSIAMDCRPCAACFPSLKSRASSASRYSPAKSRAPFRRSRRCSHVDIRVRFSGTRLTRVAEGFTLDLQIRFSLIVSCNADQLSGAAPCTGDKDVLKHRRKLCSSKDRKPKTI